MIRVKATREGLIGKTSASGYPIDRIVHFIALPSQEALGRHVVLFNPANGKKAFAQVLDVGPFNTHDTAYVFQPATETNSGAPDSTIRPLAEAGISLSGTGTNGSGIDLGEAVWFALGMLGNTEVDWEFLA